MIFVVKDAVYLFSIPRKTCFLKNERGEEELSTE